MNFKAFIWIKVKNLLLLSEGLHEHQTKVSMKLEKISVLV